MHSLNFGSLWVGGPLTKIQELSLSSFIFHGHNITLYVYDKDIKVPNGVKKADARDIVEEKEIFLVENSYAAFSDVFRYKMIKKTGLAWVDADTICLSDDWNFKDNIYASEEIHGGGRMVVGGVLSLPQNSEIVNYLILESQNFDKSKIKWSEIGPLLVNKAFHNFGYMDYVYPQKVFCGINFKNWNILWEPSKLDYVLKITKESKSISVYNQQCTRFKIDKNNFPPGSAMDYFYNKFNLDIVNPPTNY